VNYLTGTRILEIAGQKLHEAVRNANKETQSALKESVEKALAAVEEACPAALQTTPHGVTTAYGPRDDLAQRDRLLLVATAKNAVIIGIDGIPPKYELPHQQVSGAVFWGAIHALVRRGDPDAIAAAVFHRIGDDKLKRVDEQAATIKSVGAVPLIVALAAQGKGRHTYCGMIAMISLPPPISVQLAMQESSFERKQ